jgi:heterodisulfide reductase subunit A
MRYPQATPQAYSINMQKCMDKEALAACCPVGAILLDDQQRQVQKRFGSVVLAPGAAIFDPGKLDHFSYGTDPDVLTSLDYERILSASGPTFGQLERPSNGQMPRKIAWIQCAGSRGLQRGAAPYCSSACCMFALKEAIVTKERFQNDIETTIFFMDMRTFGKDYERYYEKSRKEHGIRFVRSRPHSVVRKPGEQQVTVTFTPYEASDFTEEGFDLVVLSAGFRIDEKVRETAQRLCVDLNAHGFAQTSSFDPVATSRPGVYVCGMFESPKDIPETMVQASAAACRAAEHVSSGAEDPDADEVFPP